jgi:hypothetical protein
VAIVVQTTEGAFSIAITVGATADPAQTTPAIEGILSSFKTTSG